VTKKSKNTTLALFNVIIFLVGVILFTVALLGLGIDTIVRVYMNLIGEILFIIFFSIAGFSNLKKRRYFEGVVLSMGAIVVLFLAILTIINII